MDLEQYYQRSSIITLALVTVLLVGCIEGERGEQGEMGAQGEMGEKGDMGEPGMDGKDADEAYRPQSFVDCAATLDLVTPVEVGQDGVKETGLRFTIKTYTNGDVDVSCLVAIGSSGQGGSGSSYHIAGSSGAMSHACGVVAEYGLFSSSDGNAGSWRFVAAEGEAKARYADTATNPLNGNTYDFTADNCIAKVLGDDGKWTDSNLADVLK